MAPGARFAGKEHGITYATPLSRVFKDFDAGFMPSFDESMKPVLEAGLLEEGQDFAEDTKEQAKDRTQYGDLKGDILPVDCISVLIAYCAEDPPMYSRLTAACYEKNRRAIDPFKIYLWHLVKTLQLLAPYDGAMVNRGVKDKLVDDYPKGRDFVWHGPVSTTKIIEVVETFLGTSGDRTLFQIELTQMQARDISRYSPLAEGEVLLPPGCKFTVVSVLKVQDLAIIQLKEIPSTHLILNIGEDNKAPGTAAAPTTECSTFGFLVAIKQDGADEEYELTVFQSPGVFEVAMHDFKKNQPFLKRLPVDSLELGDLQVYNKVRVHGRELTVTGYNNDRTRDAVEAARQQQNKQQTKQGNSEDPRPASGGEAPGFFGFTDECVGVAPIAAPTAASIEAQKVELGSYEPGQRIEHPGIQVGAGDFTIYLKVRPKTLKYAMLVAMDRAGEGVRQFRLEAYPSGRVGFVAAGISSSSGLSWGDHNRFASDLYTQGLLKVGEQNTVAITRSGRSFHLYLNSEVNGIDSVAVDTLTDASDDKPFRIGSRLPGVCDAFDGEISEAAYYPRALSLSAPTAAEAHFSMEMVEAPTAAPTVAPTAAAIEAQKVELGSYEPGQRIEHLGIQVGVGDFTIYLKARPKTLQYGMFVAMDRAGEEVRQFRLEAYPSGRVGFVARGISRFSGLSWGDPEKGIASVLNSKEGVLKVGEQNTIAITRSGRLFHLYLNSEKQTFQAEAVDTLTDASDDKPLRIGSRLPGLRDTFDGEISEAAYYPRALSSNEVLRMEDVQR